MRANAQQRAIQAAKKGTLDAGHIREMALEATSPRDDREPRTASGKRLASVGDEFKWPRPQYEVLRVIVSIEDEAAAAERLAWADGLAMGMSQGPEMGALTRGVHRWFCGDGVKHGDKGRPHIGWACERGAEAILATLREGETK